MTFFNKIWRSFKNLLGVKRTNLYSYLFRCDISTFFRTQCCFLNVLTLLTQLQEKKLSCMHEIQQHSMTNFPYRKIRSITAEKWMG